MEINTLVKRMEAAVSRENWQRVVKWTNALFFASFFLPFLREKPMVYGVFAVYLLWFLMNVCFFALRRRALTATAFALGMIGYLYVVCRYSLFV